MPEQEELEGGFRQTQLSCQQLSRVPVPGVPVTACTSPVLLSFGGILLVRPTTLEAPTPSLVLPRAWYWAGCWGSQRERQNQSISDFINQYQSHVSTEER